jgi:putative resolvase
MKKMLRVHEVAEQLNVSPHAVRLYVIKGELECSYTPRGQRVFTQEQVDAFKGITPKTTKRIAFYARSSSGDPTLIKSQFDALEETYDEPVMRVSDKSSGLNENRPGLWKLVNKAKNDDITHIAVTQKDRLTRFGYRFIEELFKTHGVEILVLGSDKELSLQEELMQDFMNLIASFSGKFYRLRGYEQQRSLLNKAVERLDERS